MIMNKIYSLVAIASIAVGVSSCGGADVTPGSSKASRNLIVEGNALYNDSNFYEALDRYDRSLALDAASPYAQYDRAATLVQLGGESEQNDSTAGPAAQAAEIFKSLVGNKAYPALAASSAFNLGNIAFHAQNYGEAIKWYKASLRLRPESVETRQNLLLALKNQQENKDDQQQEQQQEQQQDQQQQQQQQQQQEQQEQQQQPSQSAEQLMQAVQNKENSTRRQQPVAPGHPTTDKPW